jgi:hypothetical protein
MPAEICDRSRVSLQNALADVVGALFPLKELDLNKKRSYKVDIDIFERPKMEINKNCFNAILKRNGMWIMHPQDNFCKNS